jgi:hypothetical protein
MIKIDTNIPMPKHNPTHWTGRPKLRSGRKGDGRQEAILKLEVGHSFFLKTSESSAGVLRWWARARFPERDFVVAREGKGVRTWRFK